MEDKQAICDSLLNVIKLTRCGDEIDKISYYKISHCDEYVIIRYVTGYKRKINVSMDSGCALIRDIMKVIN